MGYIADRFAFEPRRRSSSKSSTKPPRNKFTHFRGSILGNAADRSRVYLAADRPNTAYFDELDRRVLAIHKRGITIDLILASDPAYVTEPLSGLAVARAIHSIHRVALRAFN